MSTTITTVEKNNDSDGSITQLLNIDFTLVSDELYKICKFYSQSQNNPGYFKWQEGKNLVYKDCMNRK